MKRKYDRRLAVEYAKKWALGRNPLYYNFDGIGGDCTNFASQVIYAGAGIMNPTPTYGWYYFGTNNRSPSWTGVEYLYRFLVNNQGLGPVAEEADLSQAQPGDIVQLSFNGEGFQHTPVVVSVGNRPSPQNTIVAAHTYDAENRPLSSYTYAKYRLLHIIHVNV